MQQENEYLAFAYFVRNREKYPPPLSQTQNPSSLRKLNNAWKLQLYPEIRRQDRVDPPPSPSFCLRFSPYLCLPFFSHFLFHVLKFCVFNLAFNDCIQFSIFCCNITWLWCSLSEISALFFCFHWKLLAWLSIFFFCFSKRGLFNRDYSPLFLLIHSVSWTDLLNWLIFIYLESA